MAIRVTATAKTYGLNGNKTARAKMLAIAVALKSKEKSYTFRSFFVVRLVVHS